MGKVEFPFSAMDVLFALLSSDINVNKLCLFSRRLRQRGGKTGGYGRIQMLGPVMGSREVPNDRGTEPEAQSRVFLELLMPCQQHEHSFKKGKMYEHHP